jgi:putative tricarboxylic transport membrane protein
MDYKNVISSLFWMGVSILFCVGAFKYGITRSGIPGAGFFPLLAGFIMIVLSLVVLGSSFKKREESEILQKEKFFPRKTSLKRLGLTLAGLFFYWFLLESVGFIGTTFLFLVYLLRFIEPQGWTKVLVFSALATGVSYLLFSILLKVQLPIGFLGV